MAGEQLGGCGQLVKRERANFKFLARGREKQNPHAPKPSLERKASKDLQVGAYDNGLRKRSTGRSAGGKQEQATASEAPPSEQMGKPSWQGRPCDSKESPQAK